MRSVAPEMSAPPGALHRALRAATRSEHVNVDKQVSQLDLSSRDDYAVFLCAHESLFASLETDWRDEDKTDFSALSRCLRSDLKALNPPMNSMRLSFRAPLLPDQRLGAAYVIRGSRLGADALRRRSHPARAISYFDFVAALSWPEFLLQLETPLANTPPAVGYDVIRGARLTFDLLSRLLVQAAQ